MVDADDNSKPTLMQQLLGSGSQQKIALMVAAAASIALLAGLWLWGQDPDYKVLYSNLSDRDGGAIIEVLQQQNIPYKFAEGGGALLVPANLVHETRLRLASQGLPKGGTNGFELMENQKFGTSQFLEQVNYQRALEGELARSVETVGSVQSARVHLAIPKPSVFVKEQQKPTASVVLSLYPGRTLDSGQITGIIHLISSSVPNMPAQSVTVVDQSGNLLSAGRDNAAQQLMDATQLKYLRQIEQDYIKRIEDLLVPITGQQNVRVQVTANIDFSQTEQTAETFRPNQPPNQAAVRSTQTVETLNGTQGTGGVPGALSNQPPQPATAPIVTPANAIPNSTTNASNTHKEATLNYEVDRTIQHTKLPIGSIQRLSVAVVMNNRSVTDAKGKVSSVAYSDAEKAQITALVKEAMGFDAKRGDSLNVLNSAFNDTKEVIPELPWWKQPEMIELLKEVLKYGAIFGAIAYLLFGVIRPAVRNATAAEHPKTEEEAAAEAEALLHEGDPAHPGAEGGENLAGESGTKNPYEENLRLAKQLAKDDPKIVASVIKEWVNKE